MLGMLCYLACLSPIYGGLIAGYWALLYKASWAHGMAIISIIYFGLNVIFGCINGIVYGFVLFRTANAKIIVSVLAVWAIFFGVGIWGLVASIDLLSTGSMECPTDGSICSLMIILFGISLFSSFFHSINSSLQNMFKEVEEQS